MTAIRFILALVTLVALLIFWNRFDPLSRGAAFSYLRTGGTHLDAGEYNDALAAYNKALEINPKLKSAYNQRGLVKHELGQYEKAIADFRQAIRIDSDYGHYYYNRARAFHELERYDDAIADLNIAIDLNPSDAAYYFNRSVAKWMLWNLEDATIDMETALVVAEANGDTEMIAQIKERLEMMEERLGN